MDMDHDTKGTPAGRVGAYKLGDGAQARLVGSRLPLKLNLTPKIKQLIAVFLLPVPKCVNCGRKKSRGFVRQLNF